MRLLYSLPNLHEIKENRGTVVEEGGSLVDKSDSCFWKTEGRRGGWKEGDTEGPKQETPPSRWAHRQRPGRGLPRGGGVSLPPSRHRTQTGHYRAGRQGQTPRGELSPKWASNVEPGAQWEAP